MRRRFTAVAILRLGPRFVLQHRDDRPGVTSRGLWGLFGGEMEPPESPEAAIVREIREELALDLVEFERLWTVDHYNADAGSDVRMTVFTADVSARWSRHRLGEGQDVRAFAVDELPDAMVPIARALIERYVAERRRADVPRDRSRGGIG